MNTKRGRMFKDAAWVAAGVATALVVLLFAISFTRTLPEATPGRGLLERAGTPGAPYGGTLTVVRSSEPQTLNPLLAVDSWSLFVLSQVYNSLFTNDVDCATVPDLVRSWKRSQDGLVWTFYLRRNVKWHDGAELTSSDVEFTYRSLLDPRVGSPRRAAFAFASGTLDVRAVDRYTVRMTLPGPVANLIPRLTVPILPEHLFAGTDIHASPYNERPVGTGPFAFESWDHGRRLTFRAFPDYFEGRAYVDRLQFDFQPDPSRRVDMLVEGEADAGWVAAPFYERVAQCPDLRTYRFDTYMIDMLGFNVMVPALHDPRTRQGIACLIDRQGLINGPLAGVPRSCQSFYSPLSPFYAPPARQYENDPRRAAELLQAAGWSRDGGGWVDSAGQPLALTIMVAREGCERALAAQYVCDSLRSCGIDARVLTVPEGEMLRCLGDGSFEAAVFGMLTTPNPDHSTSWRSSARPPAGMNVFNLDSHEVDRLLDEGLAARNADEQHRIYAELQRRLMEEMPAVPLYLHTSVFCVNRRVVTPFAPSAGGEMLYAARWYLEGPRE